MTDDSKLEKAKQPITVYKRLVWDKHFRKFLSPYQITQYKRGDVKTVLFFTDMNNTMFRWRLPKNKEVNKGLHVHTCKLSPLSIYGPCILVECTIPKGTRYIRGKHNEIVTLKLVVGKAIMGDPTLVKLFNDSI